MKVIRLVLIFISVLGVSTGSFGQVENSESILDLVEDEIDALPGSSSDVYADPSSSEGIIWRQLIADIVNEEYSTAATLANSLDYELVEVNNDSVVYYLLRQATGSTNYWGTYVFNPEALRPYLVIQSPHPKYDEYTGNQGIYVFKNTGAYSFFLSGTHRCNSSTATSCDGSTSVCGGQFKISDPAHYDEGAYQMATEVVDSMRHGYFVQLHGFGENSSYPDVIMSSGARKVAGKDKLSELQENLEAEDTSLTFKVAHVDTDWDNLIAFTNVQGRLLNHSLDPCGSYAEVASGRFLHLEQAPSLRDSESDWLKIVNALKNTFEESNEIYEATSLVINEYLPYPSSTSITEDNEVDANGDGFLDGYDDEFIELVNNGIYDLDISGWKLSDGAERHVFPDNTVIPAQGAIVVFGGGTPSGTFGNSITQTASTDNLGLSNSGDAFYVLDSTDFPLLAQTYATQEDNVGTSLTRSPDVTGSDSFITHSKNPNILNDAGESASISPGTKVDGTYFANNTNLIINEFLPYPSISSLTDDNEVDANGDGTLDGYDDEFIELVNAGTSDLDISGWKLNDGTDRHVFPSNTIVPAQGTIVVFGGGTPTGSFGNAIVQVATTDNLGLSNLGDTFYVLDDSDTPLLSYTYESSDVSIGVSFTRSPDVTGLEPFVAHPENSNILNDGGGSAYISPGTKANGTYFANNTDLVINEFLAYPSISSLLEDSEVDANGDGTLNGYNDEFIELVNTGTSDLDISGWKLNDGTDRHVFPSNTIVPAQGAIVVFGGGTPTGSFGDSEVQVASTGNLGLLNSGDTFYVLDDSDTPLLSYTYGASDIDIGVSLTRSPDVTGTEPLVAHPGNANIQNDGGGNANISPGTKVDGTYFITSGSSSERIAEADSAYVDMESMFTIYPNPAEDVLHFATSQNPGHAEFILFDLNGNCLIKEITEDINYFSVDVSGLKSGIYLYVLQDDNSGKSYQGKVLIK